MSDQIQIYQTNEGQTQVEVRFEQETVWLSQAQMVELFGRDQSVVSRHILNALSDGEVSEKSNMQKMHIANLDQSVFGEPAYPSIESKAAHLLYFVVKNHPFSDGNKRSGAFLFVDFLHRNDYLMNKWGEPVINDSGLAALTLLVAESDPRQKETLIRLIMNMLAQEQTVGDR